MLYRCPKGVLIMHNALRVLLLFAGYLASLLKLKLLTSTTTLSTNKFLLQLLPKHNLHLTNTRVWAISVCPGRLSIHPSVLHHQLQIHETTENPFI